MKTSFKFLFVILITFLFSAILISCSKKESSSPKTVEIKEIDGNYKLYRHNEPYYIVGGGGVTHFEELKSIGGNSVRTWSMHNAEEILDEAEKNGLTVTLGLEIGKQPWGNDFNYWSPKAVNEKIEELRKVVLKHKDHPALLMWGVGNEVHLFGGNRIMICLFIDKVCKMIHEVDPNHPVMTTTTAGKHLNKYGFLRILCPNLDVLGINAFERLPLVNKDIRNPLGWNKAYLISEFGVKGPWESSDTEWGAPIEKSSTENVEYIQNYWNYIVNDKKYSLGGYAFYWGYKFEVTNSWFSLFSEEGKKSEIVNYLEESWTGVKPNHEAPKIGYLKIMESTRNQNIYLNANDLYNAKVKITNNTNGNLNYAWEIRADGESAHVKGRHEYVYSFLFKEQNNHIVKFYTPSEIGGYRLFVFVYDEFGNFATANIPFYVTNNKI